MAKKKKKNPIEKTNQVRGIRGIQQRSVCEKEIRL